MREKLLKKQPTWGLRRAQGTGQKSTTPATLTKVILVLLTMFLLPSAAWGQGTVTVTKTIYFNQSSDALSNELPVHIKEEIKNTTYIKEYDSKVTMDIDDPDIIKDFSYTGNDGAVFELTRFASTEGNGIGIIIPGKYPQVPETVKLKVAYNNSYSDQDEDGISAIIHVCDFPLEDNKDLRYIKRYPNPDALAPITEDYLTNPLTFNGGEETGYPGTDRNENRDQSELYIYVYLDGNDYEDHEFNEFYDRGPTSFTIKEVEITYEENYYGISVTGIPVREANANDILGDGTVSFTPANATTSPATPATLKLKGNEELTSIFTSLSNLTINLQGTNKITAGSSSNGICSSANTGTLTFTGTGSLEISSDCSVIRGFTAIEGLNLETKTPYEIYNDGYYRLKDKAAADSAGVKWLKVIQDTTYPLWVAGKQATAGDLTGDEFQSGDNTFNTITNVSFTPGSTNILSFNNGGITTRGEVAKLPAIISNLDNLTIQFTGENSISLDDLTQNPSPIKSLNSEASITFTSSAEGASLSCTMGSAAFTDGFKTVNYENGLGCLMTSGYKKIQKMTLNSPTISTSEYEGDIKINFNNEFGSYYDGIHYFYKIDYADSSIEDPEEVELPVNSAYYIEPETPLLLSSLTSPCTITAYTKYNTTTTDANKAKLFAIADKTIVFNDKTKGTELTVNNLEIIPATEGEGVSFKIRGVDNPDVIIPSSTEGNGYKYSIAGIGRCEVSVEIIAENPTIQVLNPVQVEVRYAEGVVTVVPDKPTITITKKDPERNYYLNTDEIAITRTSVEGENTDYIKIFYTWGDATIGSNYFHYTDNPTLSIYDATKPILAQTGTLRAWVGYHLGDNEYLMSDEVESEEFTVKTDISDYTVQGLATSATYTGAAIVPAFSVKASADAETSLTLNTDYTVSYQSVIIAAGDVGSGPSINYTDVDEMVEVGAYRIVITGTGDNYGGTTYADFAIDKADLDIVTIEAIADQPYTGSAIEPEITVTLNGEEVAADDNFYITYSQNTEVSTETLAYVTLTAIGSSECFREGSTKTASFKIVPKSIEGVIVTLSGDGFDSEKYSFVYNGENQKPTVTVEDGERLLILDTDYTLTNNGGTNVGEYTFTITGKGNYDKNTSIELFYRITPKSIAGVTISLDPEATYVYNGDEQKPVPEVNDGETLLEKDVDYIVSYSNNINAAASTAENAPTVTITGKGNYDENTTAEAFFTINQADLQDAAISKIAFGGKEYTVGDLIEIPYTGEAIQPTVEEVKINDGIVTVDASDYNVSYSNNTEISSDDNLALIIITSTGKNFTAGTSTSQGFKIVRATVTITAEDQTVTYNADKQEYDISKVEVSNNNAELVITYYATEADRTKGENALTEAPTNADTYYVRVTLNEESQQHYVADPADATFTVDQLELTNAEITLDNTELTYNGEAQTVSVTEVKVGKLVVPTDCYEVSDNTATVAGTYTAMVTAKTKNADGSDFKNNFKGSATVDWKINHRTASAAELGFTSETQTASTYYNPDEAFNLPEGYVGYIVTGTNGTNVLTTRVSYIQKGVAVLVEKGSSSANAIDEAPDPANLPLKGTSEPLEVSSIAGGTVYVLYNGEFVKSTSGTIPAKRCYLLIESSVAAGTRAFGIIGGGSDGSTAIKSINDEPSTIDNWYDMGGHRIEKPTKAGLYIKNGKKVVIK